MLDFFQCENADKQQTTTRSGIFLKKNPCQIEKGFYLCTPQTRGPVPEGDGLDKAKEIVL